jgi:hypothetical protein
MTPLLGRIHQQLNAHRSICHRLLKKRKRPLMRHMVMTLLLGLLILLPPAPRLFCQPLNIQATEATATGRQGEALLRWATSTFCLSNGYRIDNLNWNIAGNRQGSDPNVLSELAWSDITIYQLKLTNRTVIRDWVYLRGHLDYGVVVNGDNQDSDYSGDNRTLEFSRSVNGVDGNSVWDGSIGVGPRLSFFDATVFVCPMLGYAIARQELNIVDGYQVLTAPPAGTSTGPIDGLDSRYQTRWQGPWIGVDFLLSMPMAKGPFRSVNVMFTGEYHWVDYAAEANWNLRTDLQHPVSFSHEAEGTGMMVGTTIVFETRNHWGFNLGMNMMDMTTDSGLDRVYHADGTTNDTCLNEVSWRAFTFEAGICYRF